VHKKAKGLERITKARVIYAGGRLTLVLITKARVIYDGGRLTLVLIVITVFRNCKFQ